MGKAQWNTPPPCPQHPRFSHSRARSNPKSITKHKMQPCCSHPKAPQTTGEGNKVILPLRSQIKSNLALWEEGRPRRWSRVWFNTEAKTTTIKLSKMNRLGHFFHLRACGASWSRDINMSPKWGRGESMSKTLSAGRVTLVSVKRPRMHEIFTCDTNFLHLTCIHLPNKFRVAYVAPALLSSPCKVGYIKTIWLAQGQSSSFMLELWLEA